MELRKIRGCRADWDVRFRGVAAAAVMAAVLLAQGCFRPGDPVGGGSPGSSLMAAEVRVVSQPRGGSLVSELVCAFEVTAIPGSGETPIGITVAWTAPCGTHKVETFVFEGGTEVFESVYSEPGGYIGMTFWATISWRDAQGAHQVASDIANCTVY